MDRRKFLLNASSAAAALAAGASLTACQKGWHMASTQHYPVERRTLGRTGEQLSIIGFGGIIVMNQTPTEAANWVAEAVARSINYFDVAPTYGNAQERLGPALAPHRDKVFLACKTAERDGAAAEAELHTSLKLLQTDHIDLYQLHAITKVDEDVEKVFAPGGVMERLMKAREAGKIRYLGFSAHSEAAAHAALDRFDFDSILFPFNYSTWYKGHFGPAMYERVKERNMGLLALKAMARQKWPENLKPEDRRWAKAWYQPLEDDAQIALALRYTLHLPVNAMLPPGHWELFNKALTLAEQGKLSQPLSAAELEQIKLMAAGTNPVFEQTAA